MELKDLKLGGTAVSRAYLGDKLVLGSPIEASGSGGNGQVTTSQKQEKKCLSILTK